MHAMLAKTGLCSQNTELKSSSTICHRCCYVN